MRSVLLPGFVALFTFMSLPAGAACTPCTASYVLNVRYTVAGMPHSGLLTGSVTVFDGVLDLNASAVQSLLAPQVSHATLTEVVQITINGTPGKLITQNDTLLASDGAVIAWVDAPVGPSGHLHLTTLLTQTQAHPFSYVYKAYGTESPPVVFDYTLTATGNETYHSPTHQEETIAIAHYLPSGGAECRSIEGDVCLPVGCKRTSSRLDEYIGLHVLDKQFYDTGDRCVHYKIRVSSTKAGTNGKDCDGNNTGCWHCGAEYKGIVVLGGYCDVPRIWSQSIKGTGQAEANPKTNFTLKYAAAGGQLGSGLPDSSGLSGSPSYAAALTNCHVGSSTIPCNNLSVSISGDTMTVSTAYTQSVSTSKNGNNSLSSTEGVKLIDSLPFTTENGDVQHAVDVTFQGALYQDGNGDRFVDVGPFSFWTGGANNDQLLGAFDRTGIPVATIDSITPNPALFGQSVQFSGHGSGPFSTYQWFTHRQDQTGGPLLGAAANISRNDLVAGVHQIRLQVLGTNPSPFTYATLIVNQPPVAFINHIENVNDPAHPLVSLLLHDGAQTDPFSFDGGGIDFDGFIRAYEWTSDIEPGNVIGTAAQFQKSLTALGTHTITLRVQDNLFVWSAPVKLTVVVRRPPVLLVHGLCGDTTSWDELINNSWLGPQWANTDIVRRTFDANGDGITNDAPADNAQLVWQQIQQMKQTYGVRTVDLLVHSMGGLDSRAYIQGPAYQGDVNKLVMLATPDHGSTIADLALISNGYSQQDVELYIPIPGVQALLLTLGVVVDIVDFFDPMSGLVCLGQDSPALHALRPHSDFLRNLNHTYKDEGTEDYGASGQPNDFVPAGTQYFIIHGSRTTVSHTHLPQWLVDSIRVATLGQVNLNHMSLLWARDGDGVVTSRSARLDGIPEDQFDIKHTEMEKKSDAVAKGLVYLLDDPTPPAPAQQQVNPIIGAHLLGAGRGTVASSRMTPPPVTLDIDAAALRVRVSLSWSAPTAPSQPDRNPTARFIAAKPFLLVLTSPGGVRYSSDVAKPGFSIKGGQDNIDATIENPEAGAWRLEVQPPASMASTPNGVPYSWLAFEESGAFLALGLSAESVAPGDPVTIAAYVQNNNAGVTGAEVRAAVSDAKEKPVSLTLKEDARLAGLYTAQFTPPAIGTYRLLAAAKLPGTPAFNRFGFLNFTARLLPDLTISLSASASEAQVGAVLALSARVDNHGKAAASNIPVRFFDGRPAEQGRLLAERTVTVQPASNSVVSLPWPATAGVHRIVAIVDPFDISGETNTADNVATLSIKVKDNQPPIARAGADQTAIVGQSVVFDGRASTDNDRIVSFHWTFASDLATSRTQFPPPLDGGYVVLVGGFPALGPYTVRLTVTDASGNKATDDLIVHVVDKLDSEPPVANAGRNITAAVGAPVTFDGTGSHDNYGIALATWDVDLSRDSDGDGNPGNDQDLVGLSPTLLHGYAKPGVYRARLTVRDAVGNGPSTSEVVVTVGMPVTPDLTGNRADDHGGDGMTSNLDGVRHHQ